MPETRRLDGAESEVLRQSLADAGALQPRGPHGWTDGCPCTRCLIVGAIVWSEAVASVRMSHDERVQTVVIEEDERRG